nr:alanyl-tRNA editing protein [Candidatus Njordarchaeum guaymaensis]
MDLKELAKDSPKTELIYWRDSYARSFESEVIRVVRDKRNVYLVTQASAFHPKSGGQPSDSGTLTDASGLILAVKKVMIVGGVVVHYCSVIEGHLDELKSGARIDGEINWDERFLAMRRHTAGHLFDHCLEVATGVTSRTVDSWLGVPCYVTYAGEPPSQSACDKAVKLEVEGIRKGLPVRLEFVSYRKMLEIASDAPNIERLPESELMRIVTIEGCKPIPCGGTHVNNTAEIGNFKLHKVEKVSEGNAFRVYFDVK